MSARALGIAGENVVMETWTDEDGRWAITMTEITETGPIMCLVSAGDSFMLLEQVTGEAL